MGFNEDEKVLPAAPHPSAELSSSKLGNPPAQGYSNLDDGDAKLFVYSTAASIAPIYTRPTALRRLFLEPTVAAWIVFVAEIILTLAPIPFLMIAFAAWKLDRQPLGTAPGPTVESAARIAPTVFPIIFAAIIGRLMRGCAVWAAQNGSKLGVLEQLQGSQALLASIERTLTVRALGPIGILIVFLWLLSPLGGQSSLRVLSTATYIQTGARDIYYMNTTSSDEMISSFSSGSGSSYAHDLPMLKSVLTASMLSEKKTHGNSDIWGNVKIPFLHELPSYKTVSAQEQPQSPDRWYEFSESNYSSPYSTLTGMVINGLQSNFQTSFTTESTYFNLTCEGPAYFPYHSMFSNTTNTELVDWSGPLTWSDNYTFKSVHYSNTTRQAMSYILDYNNRNSTSNSNSNSSTSSPYTTIYASRSGAVDNTTWSNWTAYRCATVPLIIESQILCTDLTCQVQRMRQSPTRQWWLPSRILNYNSPIVDNAFFQFLSEASAALSSSGAIATGNIEAIDAWLADVADPFNAELQSDTGIDFNTVSADTISLRLGALMNTAWQIGIQRAATTRQAGYNVTELEACLNATTCAQMDVNGVEYLTMKASGTASTGTMVYVAKKGWIGITLVVSSVLFVCGVVSLRLKYRVSAPDVLGYVSSMRIEGEWEEMCYPEAGDGVAGAVRRPMDGLERARALRDVRVRIGEGREYACLQYVADE